jgi:hypothetical protein
MSYLPLTNISSTFLLYLHWEMNQAELLCKQSVVLAHLDVV